MLCGKRCMNMRTKRNPSLRNDIDRKTILELRSAGSRKKGCWETLHKTRFSHVVRCSVCGRTLDMHGVNAGRGDANFCPSCGSDMRG